MAQGREDEAYSVLEKLHFDGSNREWLDAEFAEICEVRRPIALVYTKLTFAQQIRREKEMKSSSLMDLVNTKPMLKRTLIACGVQAFGQVSHAGFL